MYESPFKPLQRTLDEREELFKDVLQLPLEIRRDLVNKLLWSLPRNDITKLNEQLSGILQRDIIGSLPPELSILILSKLDFEDILICGSVCRKWRCIVEEQALWALLCASSSPPIKPAHPTWSDLQTTRSILSQPKSTHNSDEDEEEEYDDRFGYGYIEPTNTAALRSDSPGLGLGMKSGLRRNVWERSSGNGNTNIGDLPIFSYPTIPPTSIKGGKDISPIPSHLAIPSIKPQPNFKHLYISHRIIHQRMTTPRPIHYNTHMYSPGTERIKMVPKPLTIDMITSVKNGGLPGHSEAIYSLSLINHEMKFDLNPNCMECHQPTSGLRSITHQAEISPPTINRSSTPGPLMPGQRMPSQTTVKGREWLLTGSRDRTLRLWYLGMSGPKVLKILQGGHSGSVLSHCVVKVQVKIPLKSRQQSYASPTKSQGYSPTKGIEGIDLNDLESDSKGRMRVVAVSGGSDGKICLWDIEGQGHGSTVEPEKTIQGHRDSVLCVRANDKYVVSCSKDKTIKLFDIHTLETKLVIGGSGGGAEQDDMLHKGAVNAVGLTEDYIISASGDKTLRIWSIHSGQLLFTVEAHSRGIASIDFSSDATSCEPILEQGERWKGSLVTGASDSSIKVFHLIERDLSTSFNSDVVGRSVKDDKRSEDVSMDSDSTSSSISGTLAPPPVGRTVYLKEDHTMWSPCICPPGLSRPNDTHPQERCRRCGNRGHTELVRTVNIGERVVVSGSYDSKVKVWDRKTAQHLIDLSGHHTGRIFSVTSDKYKIISTGLDCRINIWDFAYDLDTSFVEP